MRRLIYTFTIIILIGGIVLTAYAPDEVSVVMIVIMEGILFLGTIFGVIPVVQYSRGFQAGLAAIVRALEVQSGSTWAVLSQNDDIFRQRTMDSLFQDYKEKVQAQQSSNQVLSDIDDYVNEEALAMRSWQSAQEY